MTPIYLKCSKCSCSFVLNGADKDLGLIAILGKPRCPTHGCKGKLKNVGPLNVIGSAQFRRISAFDLHYAIGGAGLPEERLWADPVSLQKELKGKKVKGMKFAIAGRRSYIQSIAFEDGQQIHFAVSTRGVLIHKMTRENKHVGR